MRSLLAFVRTALPFLSLASVLAPSQGLASPSIVVLVSADAEWAAVQPRLASAREIETPFGECREGGKSPAGAEILFCHGGWGKVAAAASTQYALDRWHPELLVNLGTCGGFRGHATVGQVLLVTRTVIYDIVEQMGDADEAIRHYATDIDTSWAGLELPKGVTPGLLVSADRDIVPSEIEALRRRFSASAADWESGAIAWVARRNATPLLILRGVTDLVDSEGGEAYGNEALFVESSRRMMGSLLDALPFWIARWEASKAAR